jgi:hypothetical protein
MAVDAEVADEQGKSGLLRARQGRPPVFRLGDFVVSGAYFAAQAWCFIDMYAAMRCGTMVRNRAFTRSEKEKATLVTWQVEG